jgi:MoxR-like ATPase
VFTNLVLGDEINRAPPKTQAALLEAMQERQVTVEGTTRALPRPFHVLATQNPIEYEGTYPLPEAQLDRFAVRVAFGYPTRDEEVEILRRRLHRGTDEVEIDQVGGPDDLRAMQQATEKVHVSDELLDYISRLVEATRSHPSLETGSSPRGSISLLKTSRAWAAMAGRDFVTPEDVKQLAVPTLAHRLILKPEIWVQGVSGEDLVADLLRSVPTPQASDVLPREA